MYPHTALHTYMHCRHRKPKLPLKATPWLIVKVLRLLLLFHLSVLLWSEGSPPSHILKFHPKVVVLRDSLWVIMIRSLAQSPPEWDRKPYKGGSRELPPLYPMRKQKASLTNRKASLTSEWLSWWVLGLRSPLPEVRITFLLSAGHPACCILL